MADLVITLTKREKDVLREAQSSFDQLLAKLSAAGPHAPGAFRVWVEDRFADAEAPPFLLHEIAFALRAHVLPNVDAPGERIVYPDGGENADCQPGRSLQIDSFVYDDEDVDDLVNEGIISRSLCTACGGSAVATIPTLSHSLSVTQLRFIFQQLLPTAALAGKTVVDIGSRIGAVLYGAYVFTDASKIVGIEMQPHFCDIQRAMVSQFALGDRIEIVESDIRQQGAALASADVIVLNNVFEFFADMCEQQQLWKFILNSVRTKPGVLLVSNPALADALATAQIVDIDANALFEEMCIDDTLIEIPDDLESFHLYRVL